MRSNVLPDLFKLIFKRRVLAMKGIPGPKPRFPVGNLMEFLGGDWPWEVCARLGNDYGGMTLLWLFGKPAIVLNDPNLIEDVLQSHSEEYYKEAPCAALRPVITRNSLFITNPPQWQAVRKGDPLSLPQIDRWLESQLNPVRKALQDGIAALVEKSKTKPIDLYEDIQRLAFDAFAMAFWGRVLEPKYYEWFRSLADMGGKRILSKLPLLPPLNPKFLLHRHYWYKNLTALIREARAGNSGASTGLLHEAVANRIPLSDEELAQSLATNFFGGVFSCSSTMIASLYLLSKHPEERLKLQSAIQAGLSATMDFPQLNDCRQLDYVTREAMRYYPAVPIYFRNSSKSKEVKLGEFVLPKNTLIFISNWWLHKMSPHWEAPEEFRPDRWDNGVAAENPVGSGYFFPFGRGPRMCIGSSFAMFFIKLALATIYQDFDVELDPKQEFKQSFYFGVMIPKGLQAQFTKREPG
jgi:cytochrome P450